MRPQHLLAVLLFAASALVAPGCSLFVGQDVPADISPLPATLALGSAGGRMTVRGEINGQPLTFAIDTGSTFCTLSADAARRAGLVPGRRTAYRIADVTGIKREYPQVRVKQLLLPTRPDDDDRAKAAATRPGLATPPVVLRDVEFAVGPAAPSEIAYDGVLGLTVLDRAIFDFDAPENRLDLLDGELTKDNSLPLKSKGGGLFVSLAGPAGDIPAMLDTGNTDSLTLIGDPGKRVRFASPPVVVGVGAGIHSDFQMRAGRLADDLTLGPIRLERPIIALIPARAAQANVGNGLLKRYPWALDARTRRMQFYDDTRPFQWDDLPVVGFAYAGENNAVTWVLPGGSADAAGLRVGDEIVTLNGRPIGPATRPSFAAGRFPVVVRRGGEQRTLKMGLTRLTFGGPPAK